MPYLILIIIIVGVSTFIMSKIFKNNKKKFRLFLIYLLIAYAVIIGLILCKYLI
jgi:uncharacterized membrane protein